MTIGPDLKTVPSQRGLSRERPAAAYLRSATQLEGDALHRQLEAIVPYARDHGMQPVRVYCDEYGSGLRNGGRWGRFQDPGQGAHLEFECRKVGIEVHYCAEAHAFGEIDLSVAAKMLKHNMAIEYVRELAARQRHTTGTPASADVSNVLEFPTAKPAGGAIPQTRPQ